MKVKRSVIVGPPKAGKSSLKHLLVQNAPRKNTGAKDTPEVVSFSSELYAVKDGSSAWRRVNSDIMRKSLHACITNKAYEENDQYAIEEIVQTVGGKHEAVVEKENEHLPAPKRLKVMQEQLDPIALLDEQHSRLLKEMEAGGEGIELKDVPLMEDSGSASQLVNSDIIRKSLYASITSKAYEENDQYPIEEEVAVTEEGKLGAFVERQKEALHVQKCPKSKQDQSDLIALPDEQHSRLLRELDGEGKVIELRNAFFIHLLDTCGQPSFQDVLPLLLDVPCTYIQVFNAARDLDRSIHIASYPDQQAVEEANPQLKVETGWELMLRSFSSMQTVAHRCSKEEECQLPQLHIYVVGTFKDPLVEESKATQEIGERLRKLERKPYYNAIQWNSAGQPFFLIHTMAGKDEKSYIGGLREGLSSMGSSLKVDVPVVWFICQEITSCISKKFFKFQDLKAFCLKHEFVDGENADRQFRALLQLFSLIGFYSYFNLEGVPDDDNFVCTDTVVFLNEVSKLLAVQFIDPKSSEMATFKKTGILVFTTKLFQELGMCQEMDPYWFLETLQHLGIAARLPDQQYFIPAILPPCSGVQNGSASGIAPLCLTYKTKESVLVSYSCLPQGVFCHLAVELIRQDWKIMATKVSRDLLTFRWKEFEILLRESPGYISLILRIVEKISNASELHSGCKDLLCTIEKCLACSSAAVMGSHFSTVAELAVGFVCPCNDVTVPHLAVLSSTKKSFECLKTSRRQACTNKHRIWFSSVDGVKVSMWMASFISWTDVFTVFVLCGYLFQIKYYPDEDIWVLEDIDGEDSIQMACFFFHVFTCTLHIVSRSPDPFLHFRCCVIGRKGSGSFPKHKLFHPRTATVYLTPLWDDNSEVLIRCYTGDSRVCLYNYIASKTEMANCYFCKLLQTAADVFSDLAQ